MFTLFIPMLKTAVDRELIREIFERINIGEIRSVNVVARKTKYGENTFRAFIHFYDWNVASPQAIIAKKRLESGKDVKIVYKFPWFWKVSLTR